MFFELKAWFGTVIPGSIERKSGRRSYNKLQAENETEREEN